MQRIIVDITPGFRMPTIYFSQGDVGTQFEIDLRSRFGNTLPASPTVTIQATKPSGFGFSVAATSVTNGVAVFTTTAEMTDEAGRFPAELKVVKDSVSLFSANFYMSGEATTHPEGTIDGRQETVIPELSQLVDRVEDAASSVLDRQTVTNTLPAGSQATYSFDEDTNTQTFGIPQGEAGAGAAGVTASAYSSSSTYAVGDYVIHNSNLYRCTTAITTAESFTAAHWTQVVLGDDVSDLKSNIDKIVELSYTVISKTSAVLTKYPTDGYINNDTGAFAALSNYHCYYFTMPESCDTWFDTQTEWGQIAVYDGDIFNTSDLVSIGALSRNTLPYENNKLHIAKGMKVVICISNTDFHFHYANGVFIASSQINYIEKKLTDRPIELLKVGASELAVSVLSPSRDNSVVYKFIKYNKVWASLDYVDGQGVTQQATDVLSADCWNNTEVVDNNGNNIAQGNSNFIVKTMDSSYHCGDGHGNEVADYVDFLCDGVSVDIGAMSVGESVNCADFRMVQRTKMYKVGGCINASNDYNTNYPAIDTDGNPIVYFKHFMELHISDNNEVEINNKLLVMRDGISFNQCHGAMLQCNYGDFSEVICNNNEETRNIVASNGAITVPSDSTINLVGTSQKCNRVEMYGNDYYIKQEMYQNDIDRIGKTRVLFFDYTNRLKCYFQPVIADFGKFSGETIETFNNGDSISVTNRRVIELN